MRELLPIGAKIGHILNAQDQTSDIPPKRPELQLVEMAELNKLGFLAEPLDLRAYFGRTKTLEEKLQTLDGLWISGGNTFVLRMAMRLSGFDTVFSEVKKRPQFLYAGYSAAICVLCDSLKYIRNVDDPEFRPYQPTSEAIWEGLGVFNYGILPHYRSNHPESEAIERDVQACIDNKWLFKVLKDGEVMIMDDVS